MSVSIVIADDHGVLRGGLRALLNADPELRVTGEAADGAAALELAQALHPDVLLADISMPEPNGIEVARLLRSNHPQIKVVILTMHEDEGLVHEAQQSGAKGFVPKRAAESDLVLAIKTVVAGGNYWPQLEPQSRQYAASGILGVPVSALTSDELRLLSLIAHACTNLQIAQELAISVETVDHLRGDLMRKLGLRSRVDIIRYAHQWGIV